MDRDARFDFRNAGGTSGGAGKFFAGLAMMMVGGYLFLHAVSVGIGFVVYSLFGWGVTSGSVLIPAIIGVALIFYNGRSLIGWVLAVGSLLALVAGVIMSIRFTLLPMPLFDLLLILGLFAGGAGLFLRSLRHHG